MCAPRLTRAQRFLFPSPAQDDRDLRKIEHGIYDQAAIQLELALATFDKQGDVKHEHGRQSSSADSPSDLGIASKPNNRNSG